MCLAKLLAIVPQAYPETITFSYSVHYTSGQWSKVANNDLFAFRDPFPKQTDGHNIASSYREEVIIDHYN